MMVKQHKIKDTPHFDEARDKLRTAFALPLIQKHGTEDEGQRIMQIARTHSHDDFLSVDDKMYRDELVVKYLPPTFAWTLTREMMVKDGTICSDEELH